MLLISILSPAMVSAKTQAPIIHFQTAKKREKDGKIRIDVKIEDKSGIKNVKYAIGLHRKPFFKYSFYKSKVKNVTLSSANKLEFHFKLEENSSVTVFAENKKGQSLAKAITAKEKSENSEKKPSPSEGGKPTDTTKPNTDSSGGNIPPKKTENEKPNTGVGNGKNQGDSKPSDGKVDTLINENTSQPTEDKKRFRISDGPDPELYTIHNERRSVWVSFLELSKAGYTEMDFRTRANNILNDMVSRNMNTLYFHVRPFSDAMYRSDYFPWSTYASGKEGKDPGFDPLSIMVKEAHSRGIKIHAYINPYRVNYASIFEGLKKDPLNYKWKNPAYSWRNDTDENNDRNVLKHGNMYFYNPSKPEVISLITNGVREICERYDVDGVIFDDYFYPNLGAKYKENFDSEEYDEYVTEMEEGGNTALNIVAWRRENINTMVKSVYAAIKGAGKNQEFGISPAGNINNLKSNYTYYVDIERWCSEPGFMDYIEPQQYWGFDNKYVPFEKNVSAWRKLIKNPQLKLYFAIPISYLEAQPDKEWRENVDILGAMLQNLRHQGIGGFSIFRYDHMTDKYLKKKGAKEGRDIFFNLIK